MSEHDPAVERTGTAEGEDAGVPGVPGPEDAPLREGDVTRADGLDDKVQEEELPGDE